MAKFSYKKCLDANGHFNAMKAKKYLEDLGVKPTKTVLEYIKENKSLPEPKEEREPEAEESPKEEVKEEVKEEAAAPEVITGTAGDADQEKEKQDHPHKSRYDGPRQWVGERKTEVTSTAAPIQDSTKVESTVVGSNQFSIPIRPGSPVPPVSRPSNAPSNQFAVSSAGTAAVIPPAVTKKVADILRESPKVPASDFITKRKADANYRESGDNQKNCSRCKKFVNVKTGGDQKETYPCRFLGCHVALTTICNQFDPTGK